jgi:hypothetical protein
MLLAAPLLAPTARRRVMGVIADRMLEDMRLANLRPAPQVEYLRMGRQLAAYHRRSPTEMGYAFDDPRQDQT